MKSRGSMLSRIWLKCFPSSKAAESNHSAPLRLERTDGSRRKAEGSARPPRSGIEMLEGRIAPATLVNPSTVTFVDQDGDKVTVQFSKPIFLQTDPNLQATLDSVFKFSTGGITANGVDAGVPQQLQLIDLTKIPLVGTVENSKNLAAGVSITITAEQADTVHPGDTANPLLPGGDGTIDGDGFVNVGAILATHPTNSLYSFGLGKVKIDGDLGQIDAGSSKFAVGIESLEVKSLGAVANTQAGTANFESRIIGSLGSLTVQDDIKGAWVNAVNGSGSGNKAIGKIGNITIGGSLIGGTSTGTGVSNDNTGLIQSASTIGTITIGSGVVSNGTDNIISDGIIGGAGKNSGAILAGGKIASITINGDLVGGAGEKSGMILTTGEIGSVKIGVGSADHGILGGAGKTSGLLQASGKIGSLTIDGDVRGGAGEGSGAIVASGGSGTIKIGLGTNDHGILGGAGKNSGILQVGGKNGSILLNGELKGGGGEGSGTIVTAGEIGSMQLGLGAAYGILGGAGKNSGAMLGSATIKNLQLNGDLLGGGGEGSGSINAGQIKSLNILGKIGVVESGTAFAGINSGEVHTTFGLGTVNVTGNVEGGTKSGTGVIVSDGNIGKVTIGGDIVGGGPVSGGIQALGKLAGVTINGNIGIKGGSGPFSGFVQGDEEIGFVRIVKGDLKGNTDAAADRSGIIASNGSIREVTIAGSLIGGKGEGSGSIHAGRSGTGILDKVTISKQVIGGEGDGSGAMVSGDKIGSIKVLNTGGAQLPAVQGGKGRFSGSIYSEGTVASVTITGNVAGGEGFESGTIQSHGLLAKLNISGNLTGGAGAGSGSIISSDIFDSEIAGDLGKLTIGGVLTAGTGANSGGIYADGNLTSVTLGGMLAPMWIGTTTSETDTETLSSDTSNGTFTGVVPVAPGADSASIRTGLGDFHAGDVKSITVTGSVDGQSSSHSLLEIQGSLDSLSFVHGVKNGEIHVGAKLGKLTVGATGKHAVAANLENVLVTAGGVAPTSAKLATAIASITVSGDVVNSQILAGYNLDGQATNADAQIGSVKVSGNWNASDLVAGIKAVNGEFGDDDDQVIEGGLANLTSRIANVIIGGTVSGTNAPTDSTTDHFGFVAQDIGKVKIGKTVVTPGVTSPALPSDVTVREVVAIS